MAGSTAGSTTATAAGGQEQGTQTFAFIAMTCLFFFWGFITVLNDILIPFLKESFDLSYTQAMLVQSCFFGAYFIISPFAGKLIDKVGYQQGIVLGLLTMAAGCLLFYPSAGLEVYALFLVALFVLASGITILQVAANPYVAALGPEKTAASRLNLAQAANSFGTTIGPIVGSMLILGAVAADATAVQMPYVMLGAILVVAALAFRFIRLPVLAHVEATEDTGESVWSRRSLVLGALAIFLYVGGEVSIGSFLVNYFAESSIAGMSTADAGEMVAFYWGAAMVGRLVGALLMNFFAETKYLAFNALIAILMIIVSINSAGVVVQFDMPSVISSVFLIFGKVLPETLSINVAVWSILSVGFFNSIMFPTIFTLAVKGLGSMTSKGSGLVCQAIVGGALIPLVQGVAADMIGIQLSFIVPMLCYIYIGWYALNGSGEK